MKRERGIWQRRYWEHQIKNDDDLKKHVAAKRLRDWFAFTEQYSHQLHEIEPGEYMSMKREEYRRQQSQ